MCALYFYLNRRYNMEKFAINSTFANGINDPYENINWTFRNAKISESNGNVIFEQNDVEFPDFWSDTAVNIVASKYFYGDLNKKNEREYSLKQLIDRVANKIYEWAKETDYFENDEQLNIYINELKYLIVHQYFSFNSPVWFNIGTPNPQVAAACYINEIEDNMESILDFVKKEGKIFSVGSGSGVNISPLRGKSELVTGGGKSSGPISFMKLFDRTGHVVKSGGKCLAPDQLIYTEIGPQKVKDLENKDFVVLSYDPPSGRYKAKKARCWKSEQKEVLEIITDKGRFQVSYDHPFKMSDGNMKRAYELKTGYSLFNCIINKGKGDYIRVSLKDVENTRELFHRIIAKDIMNENIKEKHVHHINGDKLDNSIENLEVLTPSDHALKHSTELVKNNEHIFQKIKFSKSGNLNPMHKDSDFWKDEEKVKKLKDKHRKNMNYERAKEMQKKSQKYRMLNFAYNLINNNYDISTFDKYIESRKSYAGYRPNVNIIKNSIEKHFNNYDTFLKELSLNNHRIKSIKSIGVMDVYSIEVDCPTPDDKSKDSGHNYVIWDMDNMSHFGSGVVVFNTRRAAKMVIMNIEHPDIIDFIECKVKEEEKARALIDHGYESDFNGEAYETVAFQNANHSIRVTDEFMQAVINDENFDLINVNDKKINMNISARELFDLIAESAWKCGDPGIQFDDTINKYNSCKKSGRINSSNPCSEYMFLDNTACTLGSLNLYKFLNSDNSFDYNKFADATFITTIALDILVRNCEYPIDIIQETNRKYRTIGLGYTNLGSVLMKMGLPYDSDESREFASNVTAQMTFYSFYASMKIASKNGSFPEFEKNKDSFIEVLKLYQQNHEDYNLKKLNWDELIGLIEIWGCSNAETTVIAPTGTISLMMDSYTTGCEPELGLIKYKNLAGRGIIKFVNPILKETLKHTLNYSDIDIKNIERYIEENGNVENCEHLKDEHKSIFDCSFSSGERYITALAHVKMMEAIQKFISMSISKTVNMPEHSTKEDIKNIYMEAWKRGLKCISVYRDNCKSSQPLSLLDKTKTSPDNIPEQKRVKLPDTRQAINHKFTIGGHEGYITVGLYPDGRPGELFITMSKEGSIISGLMDAFATSISISLQYGVPLDVLVNKFLNGRYEPSGITSNKDIRFAKSITDYIFRWLELEFSENIDSKSDSTKIVINRNNSESLTQEINLCQNCGDIVYRKGSCLSCDNCGWTGGCS